MCPGDAPVGGDRRAPGLDTMERCKLADELALCGGRKVGMRGPRRNLHTSSAAVAEDTAFRVPTAPLYSHSQPCCLLDRAPEDVP